MTPQTWKTHVTPISVNTSLTHTLGLADEDAPRDPYEAQSCNTTSPFLNITLRMRLSIAAKLLCSF